MQYNGDRDLKNVASDSSTPPYLLTDLGRDGDPEIRRLVASNPNTPIEALMKLGEEFPDIIIENPVFNLLKIEEPNSQFVRLSLARSSKTDPDILGKLAATEEDEAVLCAVARNINTPIDAVKSLIWWRHPNDDGDYPYIEVPRATINNSNLTISYLEELLEKLIDSGWDDLLQEFGKLPNLSRKMIEMLAVSYAASWQLVDMPIVQKSPEIIDKIARHSFNSSAIMKIITNPITWESTIEYLAADSDPKVREAISERPNVSAKALDILLFMESKPGIPIKLLNELAEDTRFDVLQLLTKYPETPPEVLHKIATSPNDDGCYKYPLYYCHIFKNLAIHPNTSFKTLHILMSDRNCDCHNPIILSIIKDRINGKSVSPQQILELPLYDIPF